MTDKIKTINALMRYLREKKHIEINGAMQKRKLRNIGYYHGYKGYRFFHKPSNHLAYTNFQELLAVYSFDMQIKALFYPQLMQIETALKNYALEEILNESQSNRFMDAFTKVFNRHNDFPRSSEKYKSALKKELSFRNKVYADLSRDYNTKLIVQHFYEKDQPVPLWALFEILSLGEFGTMLSCTNQKVAKQIGSAIGLNVSFNSDGLLLQQIVYTIKDLRNAVAHNDTVFDVRFQTSMPNHRIMKYLMKETDISNITLDTIVDYVILVVVLMHQFGLTTGEQKRFIRSFVDCHEALRKEVPFPIYSTIIHTDTRAKLQKLMKFCAMS